MVKMCYFKKKLLELLTAMSIQCLFYIKNLGMILFLIIREIFENLYIVFLFQFICYIRTFVCAWSEIAEFDGL